MALALRGISNYHHRLIHHSDKGSQYVSDIYTDTLQDYGIEISMCDEVYENTHIERLNVGIFIYLITHRSEEHTSELQSLMRISYAVFCLKKKNTIEHKS